MEKKTTTTTTNNLTWANLVKPIGLSIEKLKKCPQPLFLFFFSLFQKADYRRRPLQTLITSDKIFIRLRATYIYILCDILETGMYG